MGFNKTISGINDLKTLFPDIANEAYGWNPSLVSAKSGTVKDWKCPIGHIYKSRPASRTTIAKGRNNPQGCPICSGKKILAGFNDIRTTHPKIAAEAHGWDPSTMTFGQKTKRQWSCSNGHLYYATPNSRTSGTGCPVCSGKKVLKGFNDLASLLPEHGGLADDWDPETVTYKSSRIKNWVCKDGHRFSRSVKQQVLAKYPCPLCPAERIIKVLKGTNDLKSTHPEVAAQADGWDTTTISYGSNQLKKWRCSKGHSFRQRVIDRTVSKQGCPYCSNHKVLNGFNDLKTCFPEIAKEAHGWDPKEFLAGSSKKMTWKCSLNHIYSTSIVNRTHSKTSCSICSGREVLSGFNDLKTCFPEIAKEAHGWDPSSYTKGSKAIKEWACSEGHIYPASINNKTYSKSGCPICNRYSFSPDKDAWLYLMKRPGEQQIGITNVPIKREYQHANKGWESVDWRGPGTGERVFTIEKALKKWLKQNIGTVLGTSENWNTSKISVKNLKEIADLAEIDISDLPEVSELIDPKNITKSIPL